MLNLAKFRLSSHLGDNVKRKIRGILRRDTQLTRKVCFWCLSGWKPKENWALRWLTKTCRLDSVSSLRENHFEDPSPGFENSNVRAQLTANKIDSCELIIDEKHLLSYESPSPQAFVAVQGPSTDWSAAGANWARCCQQSRCSKSNGTDNDCC